MKDLRILTYWGVPNFGAWAQAYSLCRVLQAQYPNDRVRQIAYLSPVHYNSYYQNDARLENAFSYNWNLIPHTSAMSAAQLEASSFDTLITGSDAIWQYTTSVFGCDPHLVGLFLNCHRKIAYAPSVGTADHLSKMPSFFQEGLRQYDAVSARDMCTKLLTDEAVPHACHPIVCDPALLWDFSQDPHVQAPTYQDYILVYGTNWTEAFVEEAKRFAASHHKILISAGYINDWCDISLRLVELRAFEWVGLFQHADYVLTSMFHGLMMSIQFGKQFSFNQVEYVKNRSTYFLQHLGLSHSVDHIAPESDYGSMSSRLSLWREQSRDFLFRAIGPADSGADV